ncbi:uncharacterized protein LOC111018357 [Momordica charantia]|uniref:Uncharacterized protein LOC111018357 n=1 Tax=Momordica charantia TaxID=3673 RepID=A0A6J1D9S6_MOMCH|nr:uncharacterized protein LOC111018357 [Momordica charantia]
MGQLTNELKSRSSDTLPSITEEPKREGKEHCKAITTQSRLAYEEPKMPGEQASSPSKEKETATEPDQPVEIEVSRPMAQQDIISRRKKLGEHETVALTKCSSDALGNPLPIKCKDPGIFKELNIGKARPTTVTLQFADRSIRKLEGKIEDVLIKVDKLTFPADFIILDCEVDLDIPIILGWPFLATGDTIFNVRKGEITMKVNDEQVTFNVLDAMRLPDEIEECSTIQITNSVSMEEFCDLVIVGLEQELEVAQKEREADTFLSPMEKFEFGDLSNDEF